MSIFAQLEGKNRGLIYLPPISFGYVFTQFGSITLHDLPYAGTVTVGSSVFLLLTFYGAFSSTLLYMFIMNESFMKGFEEIMEDRGRSRKMISDLIGWSILIQYFILMPLILSLVIGEGDIISNSLLFLASVTIISVILELWMARNSSHNFEISILN